MLFMAIIIETKDKKSISRAKNCKNKAMRNGQKK